MNPNSQIPRLGPSRVSSVSSPSALDVARPGASASLRSRARPEPLPSLLDVAYLEVPGLHRENPGKMEEMLDLTWFNPCKIWGIHL